MLMPGEYTEKDGKFYIKPGMLDGYIETDDFQFHTYLHPNYLKHKEIKMNKPKISQCDICGKEVVYPKTCRLCGRKICHTCTIWYDIGMCNDYIEPYCIGCWERGESYRDEIEQLLADHNYKLLKLEKKMDR